MLARDVHGRRCRGATEEYGEEVLQLCRRVMRLLSSGLGLEAGRLQAAFGGEGGEGACLRVNFYPQCPQPELTLGVAGHSDPGGMTMLLVDDHVKGLQVRSPDGQWIVVEPVPDAFIVNVGDQIQVRNNHNGRSYICARGIYVKEKIMSLGAKRK
jgi:isopenicillin N synthase-like dioxygenase